MDTGDILQSVLLVFALSPHPVVLICHFGKLYENLLLLPLCLWFFPFCLIQYYDPFQILIFGWLLSLTHSFTSTLNLLSSGLHYCYSRCLGDGRDVIVWLGLLLKTDSWTPENPTGHDHNLLRRPSTWGANSYAHPKSLKDSSPWHFVPNWKALLTSKLCSPKCSCMLRQNFYSKDWLLHISSNYALCK